MRPVPLPAGLEDQNIEIYIHNGEIRAIYESRVISFNELPDQALEILSARMLADRRAVKSMIEDMGITDLQLMLKQYVMCNFGNFDGQPDLSPGDGITISECWDCGQRGQCPGEGRVCGRLQCKNGMLTSAETVILFMVIEGKIDKEIALITGNTIPTIETHLKHIREKMGVNNRVEIMGWAMKRNIYFV